MGSSFDARGRLVCQLCNQAGEARRHACPVGYCPPADLCAACLCELKISGRWEKHHDGCRVAGAEFKKRAERERALLDAGSFVRVAACGRANGLVQVVFRNKAGAQIGRWMTAEVYRTIPLLEPATVEHFDCIAAEPLEVAPTDFYSPLEVGP